METFVQMRRTFRGKIRGKSACFGMISDTCGNEGHQRDSDKNKTHKSSSTPKRAEWRTPWPQDVATSVENVPRGGVCHDQGGQSLDSLQSFSTAWSQWHQNHLRCCGGVLCVFRLFFTGSCSVAQPPVQWCSHTSMQLLPPRLKQSPPPQPP